MSINPTGQQSKWLYTYKLQNPETLDQNQKEQMKKECKKLSRQLYNESQVRPPADPRMVPQVRLSTSANKIYVLDVKEPNSPLTRRSEYLIRVLESRLPFLSNLSSWNELIREKDPSKDKFVREAPAALDLYDYNPPYYLESRETQEEEIEGSEPEAVQGEGEEERVDAPAPLELHRQVAVQEEETKEPDLAASREEEAHVAAPAPAPLSFRRAQSLPEAVQGEEEDARVAANPFPAPLNPHRTQSLPERTQEQAVSLDSPFKRIRKVPGKLDQQG